MGGVSRALNYTYDAHGNRTQITHPDGYHFGMTFDAADHPTSLIDHGSTTLASFTYDNQGRPSVASRVNGTITGWSYDPISRLSDHSQDLAGSAYDIVWSHAWSPASQLVSWTRGNAIYAYPDAAKSLAYTVNGLNQYASVNTNAYTYDANGNLVSDGGLFLAYDAENRLITAGGTKSASLIYDPLGRLLETNNGSGGAATKPLRWRRAGRRI